MQISLKLSGNEMREEVDNFPILDKLSAEQQKTSKRTRIRLAIFIALLALMGIDYLVSWPQSVRKQRELVHAINGLPLPAGTVQESFQAGHKPRSGFASRILLSVQDPQSMCEFIAAQLADKGWNVVQKDCSESARGAEASSDTRTGFSLLKFSRADSICTVRYYGYANGAKRKYIIASAWGIP
ncbi:MAG TPA: hypothetical protein VG892_04775 [Terriglobales bacterium]|nr:hypothetical protein [Terriglobales bacterium]